MNYGRKAVRAKQAALNSKSIKWGRNFILTCVRLALFLIIGVVICAFSLGIGAFRGILEDTPKIRLADVVASGQASIVYDCEGNELDQYVSTNSNRIVVTMDEIPKHLGLAFVAIEDERFYQHNGIDFKAMGRAGYTFVTSGFHATQGASTITQQLLKNTIFTSWTSEGNNMVKKLKRKIQEQYLALEVTKNFPKDEILLRYMNAINLGQNTLGVEAASQRYFGKPCSELTISESAVIACITQNPTGYNPISHPEQNATRREKCLTNMRDLKFITDAQYEEAMADTEAVYERIGLHDTSYRVGSSTTGSYFSDAVYEQVYDDLVAAGYSENLAENLLTSGGLRIESTMDPTIQKIADEEFANAANYPSQVDWYLNYALTVFINDDTKFNYSKENMMSWFKKNKDSKFNLIFHSQEDAYKAAETYRLSVLDELGMEDDPDRYEEYINMTAQPQAAMAIADQSTGYVVAMVGGRGTKEGRRTLNRAVSATRSPGSTFKILASFAPAIDCAGLTLATVYNDAAFNYDDGTPVKNWYGEAYRGICSIREGIKRSLNIVAVKNITVITPQLGYDYLTNFGFTTLEPGNYYGGQWLTDTNQSLSLGGMTKGVSPYELNAAYAAIANKGTYMEPKLYSRVTDSDGNVILDNTNPKHRQVLKESTAYLLTNAMEDVVNAAGGTGDLCRLNNMSVAGKTGTTSETHDVWFAGYTPYYTCTVWAGYDNNIGMSTHSGNNQSTIAKKLWKSIMARVHEDLPNKSFEQPEDVVRVRICTKSGKLPIEGVCDAAGCVSSELFAKGTEPFDYCTVHFLGDICNYELLAACPECPFKYYGVIELPLIEDPALLRGSTMVIINKEDGSKIINVPRTSTQCQHNAVFFLNPDAAAIIEEQRQYIERRNAAAQAALDAAAANEN